MKAEVATFNQEKALEGAFSVITNLRMELFEALLHTEQTANNCQSNQLELSVVDAAVTQNAKNEMSHLYTVTQAQ